MPGACMYVRIRALQAKYQARGYPTFGTHGVVGFQRVPRCGCVIVRRNHCFCVGCPRMSLRMRGIFTEFPRSRTGYTALVLRIDMSTLLTLHGLQILYGRCPNASLHAIWFLLYILLNFTFSRHFLPQS